jgi:hypothetical protein
LVRGSVRAPIPVNYGRVVGCLARAAELGSRWRSLDDAGYHIVTFGQFSNTSKVRFARFRATN